MTAHSGTDQRHESALGNLIGNVHAFHHFTKYRVTEITLTMVKEGVIGNVDKELAGGAVFVGGTRHRDGTTRVAQAIIGFIFDWRVWFFCCICSVKPPP